VNLTRAWLGLVLLTSLVSSLRHFVSVPLTFAGWVIPLVGAMLLIQTRFRIGVAVVQWLPWVVYCALSFFLSLNENAFQRYLIMITPIVCLAMASTLRFTAADYEWMLKAVRVTALILVSIALAVSVMEGTDDVLLLAPESILAVVLGVLLLFDYVNHGQKISLLCFLLVALVPVLTTARMASLVLFLAAGVIVFMRSRRLGMLASVVVLAAAVMIFSSQAFMEKMLLDPDGPFSFDNIRTSGRSVAWGLLVSAIPEQPIFGYGSNASESYLLGYSKHFSHPHNDWLRIVFDYGFLGLVLFVWAIYATLKKLKKARLVGLPAASLGVNNVASILFGAFMLLMLTDNVILYAAFFGNLHFTLIGLALSRRVS
jgi:O-antigen ligase